MQRPAGSRSLRVAPFGRILSCTFCSAWFYSWCSPSLLLCFFTVCVSAPPAGRFVGGIVSLSYHSLIRGMLVPRYGSAGRNWGGLWGLKSERYPGYGRTTNGNECTPIPAIRAVGRGGWNSPFADLLSALGLASERRFSLVWIGVYPWLNCREARVPRVPRISKDFRGDGDSQSLSLWGWGSGVHVTRFLHGAGGRCSSGGGSRRWPRSRPTARRIRCGRRRRPCWPGHRASRRRRAWRTAG